MSASSSRKRKGTPRRKTGKAPLKRKPRKLTFRLVIEAQEMIVTYTPNYFSGDYPQGHFEFKSPHKPPRRILVSETGCWSHFAAMEEIAEASSPQEYARQLVLAFLRYDGKRPRHDADERQLALFS